MSKQKNQPPVDPIFIKIGNGLQSIFGKYGYSGLIIGDNTVSFIIGGSGFFFDNLEKVSKLLNTKNINFRTEHECCPGHGDGDYCYCDTSTTIYVSASEVKLEL